MVKFPTLTVSLKVLCWIYFFEHYPPLGTSDHVVDDSGISLPILTSKTNLKLHNTSLTPKLVEKVITNLLLSKVCAPDFIPLVVLKNFL